MPLGADTGLPKLLLQKHGCALKFRDLREIHTWPGLSSYYDDGKQTIVENFLVFIEARMDLRGYFFSLFLRLALICSRWAQGLSTTKLTRNPFSRTTLTTNPHHIYFQFMVKNGRRNCTVQSEIENLWLLTLVSSSKLIIGRNAPWTVMVRYERFRLACGIVYPHPEASVSFLLGEQNTISDVQSELSGMLLRVKVPWRPYYHCRPPLSLRRFIVP